MDPNITSSSPQLSRASKEVFVRRHLPWVMSTARRQVSTLSQADDVCRTVFAAAEKAHFLTRPPRYVADWLFRAAVAAAKHLRKREKIPNRLVRKENAASLNEAPDSEWRKVSGRIDRLMASLSPRLRRIAVPALLDRIPAQEISEAVRVSESDVDHRAAKAARKIARKLRRIDRSLTAQNLASRLQEKTAELADPVVVQIAREIDGDPAIQLLVKKTLRSLWWAHPLRWLKRFVLGAASFVFMLFCTVFVLAQTGRLEEVASWIIMHVVSAQMSRGDEDQWPPKSPIPQWSTHPRNSHISLKSAGSLDDLYQVTNVLSAHFDFSKQQWLDLGPEQVRRVAMMSPQGINLVNTNATRNGLAGVLGFEFPWSSARLELGGVIFSNVMVRFKGNGTYWGAAHRVSRPKRPYKVNLAKSAPDQNVGGAKMLNFGNLVADSSSVSDALAYEYFRQAGVPAPRTAYAFASITIAGLMENRPLGLYVLIENLDAPFLKQWFGTKNVALFKPVTPFLFKDLGDDWAAYERIYDPKTKPTSEDKRRVIDFAKVLTHADDASFRERVGDFIDLPAFAKFLAGLTLQSSYDGFLSNGQNYFMVLDPRSNRFGFIPWDLDHSWGEFPFTGTHQEREESDLFHPWIGENRLLERIMKVDEFKSIYRTELDRQLKEIFVPTRLHERLNEIAKSIRPAIECESATRLGRFDRAVQDWDLPQPDGVGGFDPNVEPFKIKRFISARAKSARAQLDGKATGLTMPNPGGPNRGRDGPADKK